MPAKIDRSKWMKQMESLTPQLKAQAGKTILKAGDNARAKLERNLDNQTGGYKSTIKSGQTSTSKSFASWVSWGNDENPATSLEQGHVDKKSGKHVKGIRVWYPIVKIINKAKRAAIKRGTNSILKSIFKS